MQDSGQAARYKMGSMPIIRHATPSDYEFVLEATSRLADFDLPPWRTAEEIAEAERRTLRAFMAAPPPDAALLVAQRDEGGLAGYAYLETMRDYFTGELHGHVGMLVVTRESQGTGAGRLLLDAADAWARQLGYRKITLNVFERNTHARAVYDRVGYRAETMRYTKEIVR